MRQGCPRVVRWGCVCLWKQSWAMSQACHMINHSPHPHLLPYTLTISLSHGTGYERHPLEVNIGKVVSGLLRSVDVLFAKLTDNTLFPGTQEIRELVQLSEILLALQGDFLGLGWWKSFLLQTIKDPLFICPFLHKECHLLTRVYRITRESLQKCYGIPSSSGKRTEQISFWVYRVRVYCLSRDGFMPGQLWVLGPALSAVICYSVWFNLLINVLELPREKGSYWKHQPKDASKNDVLESKAENVGTGSLQQLAQRYLNCTIRRDWKGRCSSVCRRGCCTGYNFGKSKSVSWMQNCCSLSTVTQELKDSQQNLQILKIDGRKQFCTESSECLEVAATGGRWDQQEVRQIDGQRNKWILKGLGRGGHCHLSRAAVVVAGDERVEDDRRWPKPATVSACNVG